MQNHTITDTSDKAWQTTVGAYLQTHLTGKARSYSGRNMYGEDCLAFTYEGYNAYICDCIDAILELQQNPIEGLTTSLLRTILTSSNQDSMGRYDLVFYFPKLKFDRELFPGEEDDVED